MNSFGRRGNIQKEILDWGQLTPGTLDKPLRSLIPPFYTEVENVGLKQKSILKTRQLNQYFQINICSADREQVHNLGDRAC